MNYKNPPKSDVIKYLREKFEKTTVIDVSRRPNDRQEFFWISLTSMYLNEFEWTHSIPQILKE